MMMNFGFIQAYDDEGIYIYIYIEDISHENAFLMPE
jgi:hypothetical protein